jgi:ATP diphosphatase
VSQLHRLVEIVAQLRGEEGCSWDRAQDLESMRPYLLEECYEVLDHMQADSAQITEELGDLLFVVLLIARICEDQGRGDLDHIAQGICDKMVRRHPHVFGGEERSSDPGSLAAWEARKAKDGRGRLDGVPRSLPALLRAHRQGEKAAAVGFDWPDSAGPLAKIREELAELEEAIEAGEQSAIAHELGDLMLATASLGRHLNTPPEATLREANDRFSRRFSRVEALAKLEGLELTEHTDACALDRLWEQAKAEES